MPRFSKARTNEHDLVPSSRHIPIEDRGARPSAVPGPPLGRRASALVGLPTLPESPKPSCLKKKPEQSGGSRNSILGATFIKRGDQQIHIQEELQCFPIFKSCGPDFVTALAKVCRQSNLCDGHAIVTAVTPAISLLAVLRGAVEVVVNAEPVGLLHAGGTFGETVLLGIDTRWNATYVAKQLCTICEICRQDFEDVLQEYPEVEAKFTEMRREHGHAGYLHAGTLEGTVNIFSGWSKLMLTQIDVILLRKLFFPGERLLVQGTVGDELYMVLKGEVGITIADKFVRSLQVDVCHQQNFDPTATLGVASVTGSRSVSPAATRPSLKQKRRSDFAWAKSETWTNGETDDEDHATDGEAKMERVDSTASRTLGRDMIKIASAPLVFGELGLLGISTTRSATVTAETICQVRVLYRSTYTSHIEHHAEHSGEQTCYREAVRSQLEVDSDKSTIESIRQVAFFLEAGCEEPFLNFMAAHLEETLFIKGQTIIREGDEAKESASLYLLTRGRVKIMKGGVQVASLDAGATFGEQTCFGLATRRTSTVVAEQLCVVHVLHPSVVMRGLEVFPAERGRVMRMIQRLMEERGKSFDVDLDTVAECTKEAFKRTVRKSPLGKTNVDFIEELSCVAEDRIYAAGDQIVQEGQRSSSMFVTGSGRASVWQKNLVGRARKAAQMRSFKIGTLTSGDVCGELSMLGVLHTRMATIQADTICTMWEITSENAMRVIERHPDALKHFCALVNNHLMSTVMNRVTKMPIFRQFDHKALTLLGMYSDPRVYFQRQAIAREGRSGSTCFVINFGRATLEKNGVVVKTYMPGSHFGATLMLGIEKFYIGTLQAYQTCHVICITSMNFLQVLEQYPSAKAKEALKQSEAAADAELRKNSTRISARKRIWTRYQSWVHERLDGRTTNADTLRVNFLAWRKRADCLRATRLRAGEERCRREKEVSEWLEKKRAAEERARQRKAEELVVPPQALQPSVSGRVRSPRGAEVYSAESMDSPREEGPDAAEEFAALVREWPAPKPSPHYNLRLWGILVDTLKDPTGAEPLLPVLLEEGRPATARDSVAERLQEDRGPAGGDGNIRPQSMQEHSRRPMGGNVRCRPQSVQESRRPVGLIGRGRPQSVQECYGDGRPHSIQQCYGYGRPQSVQESRRPLGGNGNGRPQSVQESRRPFGSNGNCRPQSVQESRLPLGSNGNYRPHSVQEGRRRVCGNARPQSEERSSSRPADIISYAEQRAALWVEILNGAQ